MADYLYRARTTTSVWNDGGGTSDSIQTLKEAGVPDFVVSSTENENVDVNPEDKFLHIQLVKRRGSYNILLNGFLTEPETEDEPEKEDEPKTSSSASSNTTGDDNDCGADVSIKQGKVVKINRFKSISRDPGTQTAVFSPCAVSVLLEDGERAPQECKVNVVQSIVYTGNTRSGAISRVALGTAVFEPTKLALPTADCVFVPMPARFARPPYVVIYDTSRVRNQNALRQLGPAGLGIISSIFSLINNQGRIEDLVSSVVLLLGGLGPAALAKVLMGVGSVVSAATSEAGKPLEAARKSIDSYLTSAPLPEPGKLRLNIQELTRALLALASVVSINDVDLANSPELRNEWLVWGWLQQSEWSGDSEALFAFAKELLKAKQELEAARQARTDAANQGEIDRADIRLRAAQETVDKFSSAGQSTPGTGGGDESYWTKFKSKFKAKLGTPLGDDRLGIENLNFDTTTSVELEIDLSVRDSECKAINYSFVCGNSSKCRLLGAMAVDMRTNIEKLWNAIRCLQNSLEAASRSDGSTGSWIGSYFKSTRNQIDVAYSAAAGSSSRYNAAVTTMKAVEEKSIKAVLKNIDKKLWNNLGGKSRKLGEVLATGQPPTQLDLLYDTLLKMENKTPADKTGLTIGTRKLPHVVYAQKLFPSGQPIEIGESDVQTTEAVVRQSSEIRDAVRVVSKCVQNSLTALRVLRDDWERGQYRCRFVHTATYPSGQTPTPIVDDPFRVADAYALVLHHPRDVLLSVAAAAIPEEQQRFIDMVSAKPGWLKRLGVDEAGGNGHIAMSFFAQMLIDEIIFDYRNVTGVTASTNYAVRSSHTRASDRALACGDLLLATTKRREFGFYHSNDVLFTATGPGRDLALLVQLLHVPDNGDVHVVDYLRRVAKDLRKVCKQMEKKLSEAPRLMSQIPSESLNSMFYCYSSGVQAAHRVGVCLGLHAADQATEITAQGNLLLRVVEASYPSLRFASQENRNSVSLPGPQPSDAVMRESKGSDTIKILARRLASLRVDPSTLNNGDVIQPDCNDDTRDSFIDDLTEKFLRTNIQDPAYAVYSVPFAHGSVTPLRIYAEQTAMFGSVPVWTEHIRWAFGQLLQADVVMEGGCNYIEPVYTNCVDFKLGRSQFMEDLKHPYMIYVRRQNEEEQDDITSDFKYANTVIRVFASTMVGGLKSIFDDSSSTLSDTVSSIAWNAERFLQAVLVSCAYDGSQQRAVCVDTRGLDRLDGLQWEYSAGVVVGMAMARALLQSDTPPYFKLVGVDDQVRSRLRSCSHAFEDRVNESGGVIQKAPETLRMAEACGLVGVCMRIVQDV